MKHFLVSGAFACVVLFAGEQRARAAGLSQKAQTPAEKGLSWLVRQQHKDGHWAADEGRFPIALTAFAGMALLMDGSTTHSGRYAQNLQRTTDWLTRQSQRGGDHDGLIGDPNGPSGSRYLFGHSYAMLFLATVLSEEKDAARRRQLTDILERAVRFTAKAQTSKGGWGYIAAREGSDFDEGPVTVAQLQALNAAERAGIKGPSPIMNKAHHYLKKCTTPQGGLVYSLAGLHCGSRIRPTLVAAAIAALLDSSTCRSPLIRKWLKFCRVNIVLDAAPPGTDYDYTHYYYAQVLYKLGDEGHGDLFPDTATADLPTWSKYRKARLPAMLKAQRADGSWNSSSLGPVYSTALTLLLFLLEKEKIGLYRRIPRSGRGPWVEVWHCKSDKR